MGASVSWRDTAHPGPVLTNIVRDATDKTTWREGGVIVGDLAEMVVNGKRIAT